MLYIPLSQKVSDMGLDKYLELTVDSVINTINKMNGKYDFKTEEELRDYIVKTHTAQYFYMVKQEQEELSKEDTKK